MSLKIPHWTAFITAAILAGCGGSGGDSDPPAPPPVQAPSGLSYAAIPALTINVAAPSQTPTVTGTVTTYSVNPALPAGLALNASSGVISGTPTVLASASSYTVTASNAGGSTTVAVSITVRDVAPAFNYSPDTFTFSQGMAVTAVTPASTGGTVITWSVQPALPSGITLNPATGVLSGTPSAVTARADYAVTAQNSGGSVAHNLSIAVQDPVLIDLKTSRVVGATTTRVLGRSTNEWQLWDSVGGDLVARGSIAETGLAILAGNTFLVQTTNTVESRDAANGNMLGSVPYDSTRTWRVLARDGSYFAIGGSTGFTLYSRTGTQRATRTGDYSTSEAFADNMALRIAKAPSGANVIENFDAANGNLTVSAAFPGTFHSWFTDGQRYFTTTGTTLRVISLSSVQEDIFALGGTSTYDVELSGYGNWFTVFHDSYNEPVNVYAVGSSSAAAATIPVPYSTGPSVTGGAFAVAQANHQWRIVDLTGSTLSSSLVDMPDDVSSYGSSFVAADPQHWWMSNAFSQIYDGSSGTVTPRYLGFGRVFDIATSTTRIAVATHAHGIQIYDSQSRAVLRTIDLDAGKLAISADGGTLAATTTNHSANQGLGDDRSVRLYSLSTGAELNVWPYQITGGSDAEGPSTSLSADGGTIVINSTVFPSAGGPAIYTGTRELQLSPDGTHVAESVGVAGPNMTANLLENGVLRQAVNGHAKTWLDDNRLMVNRYAMTSMSIWDYHHTEIYDRAGILVASTTLAHFPREIRYAGNNQVYDEYTNDILSLTTGQVVWSSPNSPSSSDFRRGGVSGNNVVFLTEGAVRIEPR